MGRAGRALRIPHPWANPTTHGMRLSLGSAERASRSRSAPAASSPSCPLAWCLARYQLLLCQGGRQGSVSGEEYGGVPDRVPSPGPLATAHLTSLQDGDHVALVEGQLSRLRARVLTLGDALGARGPAPLGGRHREEGQGDMKEMPQGEEDWIETGERGRRGAKTREQPAEIHQSQTEGTKDRSGRKGEGNATPNDRKARRHQLKGAWVRVHPPSPWS